MAAATALRLQALESAEHHADRAARQQHEPDAMRIRRRRQACAHRSGKRHDGAHGQVNPLGEDHERDTDRENAVDRRLANDVRPVPPGQKELVGETQEDAQHDECGDDAVRLEKSR